MPKFDSSKLVVPAAAVGCAVVAGLAWRVFASEPTQATVAVETVVPDATSVEWSPRVVPNRSPELASIAEMDALLAERAKSARAMEEAAPEEATDATESTSSETRSLELVIQIPPADLVEGVPVRVVLDEPKGERATRDWSAEAELSNGQGRVQFDEVPAAKSFRLRLFQGEDLYARTLIQVDGDSHAPVNIDFVAKFEQEQAAVAALRSIAAAQQQLQASAAIDTDADGGGEFGYFAELAGTQPIRNYAPGGATVEPDGVKLDPTYLPASMGVLEQASRGGVMIREGYAFLIYLPDNSTSRPIGGIAEAPTGGNTPVLPGSTNAETMWCCYAWPVEPTTPTKRAFMIHQAGYVVGTANDGPGPYVGLGSAPHFDAAFSVPGDMASEPGLASLGFLSTDRLVWTPVGN